MNSVLANLGGITMSVVVAGVVAGVIAIKVIERRREKSYKEFMERPWRVTHAEHVPTFNPAGSMEAKFDALRDRRMAEATFPKPTRPAPPMPTVAQARKEEPTLSEVSSTPWSTFSMADIQSSPSYSATSTVSCSDTSTTTSSDSGSAASCTSGD